MGDMSFYGLKSFSFPVSFFFLLLSYLVILLPTGQVLHVFPITTITATKDDFPSLVVKTKKVIYKYILLNAVFCVVFVNYR